jgi:sugar O-acyltransferase (sialic acid O-acetyltransferase NeuD family)
MPSPIAIYGAGGFAREVLELLRDTCRNGGPWNPVAFISDDATQKGLVLNGVPVMDLDAARAACGGSFAVALGVGSPVTKWKLAQRLRDLAPEFPALIHPSVTRSAHVSVERGVVITAGNILTANIVVREFSMINLACTVGHDAVIGPFATLAPGVNVSGGVRIGEGADIGTGTSILPNVAVGEWSVVGAGAVVAQDVPPNVTAVGVPAKVIKERPPAWHKSA